MGRSWLLKMVKIDTGEFVSNPSKITEKLVEIVSGLNKKYEEDASSKGLRKFKIDFKIKLYLKKGFRDYFKELESFKLGKGNLKFLFSEFEREYEKIILNNFALIYAFQENELVSSVKTMEDEKIEFLKLFYERKISKKDFDKKFGHYGLNVYELSSRRFEEYSDAELKKIAKLASSIKLSDKKDLGEVIESDEKNKIPVLIALRELGKYNILFIVREIRRELLRVGGGDVFGKSYEEVTKYL